MKIIAFQSPVSNKVWVRNEQGEVIGMYDYWEDVRYLIAEKFGGVWRVTRGSPKQGYLIVEVVEQ